MSPSEIPPTPKSVYERIREAGEEAARRVSGKKYMKDVEAFAQKIQKTYPNYDNYLAYHQLIGSGLSNPERAIQGDFEGDDSVEKFFKSMGQETN